MLAFNLLGLVELRSDGHLLPLTVRSGVPGSHSLAGHLMQVACGRPFYVSETLRHLGEAGLLRADAQGGWRTTFDARTPFAGGPVSPAGWHEAVLARVRRLPDPAARVLEAAAMPQDPFSAHPLAPACALSEVETELVLEAAQQAGLLSEAEAGGFAFAHDLVQQALDTQLGSARRRSVHRRLALGAAAAGAPATQIAGHHEAGGERLRAVPWRRRAGDEAKRLLALDEAIEQWELAIADGAHGDDALELGCAILRANALRSRDAEAMQRSGCLLGLVEAGRRSQSPVIQSPQACIVVGVSG